MRRPKRPQDAKNELARVADGSVAILFRRFEMAKLVRNDVLFEALGKKYTTTHMYNAR